MYLCYIYSCGVVVGLDYFLFRYISIERKYLSREILTCPFVVKELLLHCQLGFGCLERCYTEIFILAI